MQEGAKTKLLIAGSQRLFRVGVQCILSQHFDRKFNFHDSGDDLAVAACREVQPDIVILDADTSSGAGLELVSRLTGSPLRPKIIVITSKNEPSYLDQLVKSGAAAYLTKDCDGCELIEAVSSAIRGRIHVSDRFSRSVILGKIKGSNPVSITALSRREMEVTVLLAEGRTPVEIGTCLAISPKTVSSYKRRIHTKLETRNTADITRIALLSGLVSVT